MKANELPKSYRELLPTPKEVKDYCKETMPPGLIEHYFGDLEEDRYPNMVLFNMFDFKEHDLYPFFWSMVSNAKIPDELPPIEIEEGYNDGYRSGSIYDRGFQKTGKARAIFKRGDQVDYLFFLRTSITNCGMWLFEGFVFPDKFSPHKDGDWLKPNIEKLLSKALSTKSHAIATHNNKHKPWFIMNWEELDEVKNKNSGNIVHIWKYSK